MTDIIVKLPDGSEAHFPDGTAPDTIQSALAAQFGAPKPEAQPMSFMDRINQGAQGVNKGVAGLADSFLDLPQNLWNLSKAGAGLANEGLSKLTDGAIPFDASNYDMERGFGAVDANGQAQHPAAQLFRQLGGIQDRYDPTDLQGRLLDTAGQVIGGGGVNPQAIARAAETGLPALAGELGRQAMPAVGATVGKETMHQAAPDSQGAALVGALLGGGIGSGAQLLRPTVGTTAADAMRTVTPAQAQEADALVRQSHAMGAPVTGAEALASVQGANPLQRVQRVVESSPGGSSVMDAFMSKRPVGAASAVAGAAEGISPGMGMVDPLAVPGRVQGAATKAIGAAQQQRSALASPFYKAAESDKIPFPVANANLKSVIQLLQAKGPQTDVGGFINQYARQLAPGGFPETNVGVLDNIYKATREKLDVPISPDGSPIKNISGAVSPANRALGDLLAQHSPNLAQGRQTYMDATRDIVNPVQNSPVGQIAALSEDSTPQALSSGIKSALQIDAKPVGIDPNQIRYTAGKMAEQDPTALADFAKQHIQNAWDDANKFIRGTTPQFSGARFAQAVAGNRAQRANLTALVDGAAGPQAAQGLENVLDVFNAQAKRLEPGSATAFNQQVADELAGGGIANKVAGAASPKAWVEWVERFRYAKNAKEFAEVLTSPDSISRLQKVAESFGSRSKRVAKQGALSGISATRDQYDADPNASASPP